MRFPTLNVICSFCSVTTTIPVRLDKRTTTEAVKEQAFRQYENFCRDEGVKFLPPSNSPEDYALLLSDEAGRVSDPPQPLRGSRHGGEAVKEQLGLIQPPYYAALTIGQDWTARDAILQEEAAERDLWIERRDNFVQSLAFLEGVSCDVSIDRQLQRERQESVVSKAEEVMLYAYVAYQRYQTKIDAEVRTLQEMERKFRDEVHPRLNLDARDLLKDKRMFFSHSELAVRTQRAALRQHHAATALDRDDQGRASV